MGEYTPRGGVNIRQEGGEGGWVAPKSRICQPGLSGEGVERFSNWFVSAAHMFLKISNWYILGS